MPVSVGDRMTSTLPLTAADIVRFAAMVGDTNPLHNLEAQAKASRFGALIASGAHLAAIFTGFCAGWFAPRAPSLGLEFSFQFRRAAREGDTLHMRWEVVAIEHKETLRGDLARLEGDIKNQRDELLVMGRALVLVTDSL